jgi:hypothetical protein
MARGSAFCYREFPLPWIILADGELGAQRFWLGSDGDVGSCWVTLR